MTNTVLPDKRSSQVLRFLSEHGPFSVRGLSDLLDPPIKRRWLQDSLGRLKEKGLIVPMYDSIFRGAAVFYRITADKRRWPDIALCAGIRLETISEPVIQHRELLHSEVFAIWAEKLKQLFPDAIVQRDFQYMRD